MAEAKNGALSRKEKEYLFRRKEILEAALKLFAAKGYEGTSMQEIAGASEFSIGTLYNFFSTKEELYLTLIEEKFNDSKNSIDLKIKDITDPMDKVHAAVEAVLAFMDNNRGFFILFLGLQTMPDGLVHHGVHQKLHDNFDQHIEFFRGLMEECVKEGYLGDYDPRELGMSLIGMINTWIYSWLRGPGDKNLQQAHERILELFINGAKGNKVTPKA